MVKCTFRASKLVASIEIKFGFQNWLTKKLSFYGMGNQQVKIGQKIVYV